MMLITVSGAGIRQYVFSYCIFSIPISMWCFMLILFFLSFFFFFALLSCCIWYLFPDTLIAFFWIWVLGFTWIKLSKNNQLQAIVSENRIWGALPLVGCVYNPYVLWWLDLFLLFWIFLFLFLFFLLWIFHILNLFLLFMFWMLLCLHICCTWLSEKIRLLISC